MASPYEAGLRPVGDCVLWFAGVNWDGVQGTDLQLVHALRRPVIWVDTPRSPLRGGRLRPAPWGGVRIVREDPLIVRITSATPPFSARSPMRSIAPSVKRSQVRTVLRRLGATPDTVVYTYLDSLRRPWDANAIEVLYGTDDYVAGAQLTGLSEDWLRRSERIAVKRADLVLTVTSQLSDRWHKLGAAPKVLPNGCLPLSETDLARRQNHPDLSGRSRRPLVGLVGQLSERIDIDVLEAIVREGFGLLLVGPKDPRWEPQRFALLTQQPHVEYVGEVPPSQLPSLLLRIDVGITPYTQTAFNEASFPLKTLEYLGAGVPVVATDLPASRWLHQDISDTLGGNVADHLVIAAEPKEFASAVRRLVKQRSQESDQTRWQYAQRHSWTGRAIALEAAVADARASKL